MDLQTLDYLHELSQTVAQADSWKTALDSMLTTLRKECIFDNVAIFLLDKSSGQTEITYARAAGRGRSAEADAAWGESIAGEVLASGQNVIRQPQEKNDTNNRLERPYLFGLPLHIQKEVAGALVFVRFGGPPYQPEHVRLACLVAGMISHLFAQHKWVAALSQLESIQYQMRLQEDFVATISHELRTPLGFIKGYATTLLRQDTAWDEATQREFLAIIDEEADRLTELIENVLESARLQSNTLPMDFQPLRLEALLRDVDMRARARNKSLDVTLDFEAVPLIVGDSTRLAQVFENLFSNAIKYAPGSKIRVALRQLGDHLRVAFADQGPGIAAQHLPYIFDRFFRVPGQASGAGTGLGLFICKQIIQAHRGRIWAESTPGHGTIFYIDLPIQKQV